MDKKKILGIVGAIAVVVFLGIVGLPKLLHEHEWTEATCEQSKTCTICGKKEGEELGHSWKEATCKQSKTCTICGKKEGELGGHEWTEATCTQSKTCAICGKKDGEPLGHEWIEATCTQKKNCTRCGKIEGEYGHEWSEATCETGRICLKCKIEAGGSELGHDWTNTSCDSTDPCKRCGVKKDAKLHTWEYPKDCTTVMTCKVCGYSSEIYGEHSFSHGISKAVCPLCGEKIHTAKLNLANWKNYFTVEIERKAPDAIITIRPKYKQCFIYNYSKVKIKVIEKWEDQLGPHSEERKYEVNLADEEYTITLDFAWSSTIIIQTISVEGELRFFTDRLYEE